MRPCKIFALPCALFLLLLQSTALFANTFTLLHTFNEGRFPMSGVTLCGNTLYGTTFDGDADNSGVVYSVCTNGSNYTMLHTFTGSDGQHPITLPVVAGGWIYGTTYGGGSNGEGLIFCMYTNGSNFSVLHTFDDGLGGKLPQGDLLLVGDTLYGTTGYSTITNAYGAIYSVNTNGSNFTVLHSFTNSSAQQPAYGQLVLSSNRLYGTTANGGPTNVGAIYSICTNGSNFTVLHTFQQTDGANPMGGLVLSSNVLYGTTANGGVNGGGTVFSIGTDGGNFHQLYAFDGTNGYAPQCTLTLSGTTLYGSTTSGGSNSYSSYGGTYFSGVLFSIDTSGTNYQIVYHFNALAFSGTGETNSDGASPAGSFFLTGSNLFGVTQVGGLGQHGTLYELTLQAPTNGPATNNHPAFFAGDVSLSGDWFYLQFPNSTIFGYYSYALFPYLYRQDMGFEYFFDAHDGHGDAYFYDFASGHFWYTGPTLFPFLYDFTLGSWIYYYADDAHPGSYTANPRMFYNMNTQQHFTQ